MPEKWFISSLTDANGTAIDYDCTDAYGYHIYKTQKKYSGKLNYGVTETIYYWYVGTTKPTSLSQASVVESYPAEYTYTPNTNVQWNNIYVLVNSDKNVTFIDPVFGGELDQDDVDTTTIPGYKIFKLWDTWANGSPIKIRIS